MSQGMTFAGIIYLSNDCAHRNGKPRAGLRGRQSRQPPRAPGFRGAPNTKNRAPACSYQKIEIP